jgi:3-phosphoshikimate 1-carboxyvinyltransferase
MREPSYRVRPVQAVRGTLAVPGDKSISHRALMLAGIANGCTTVSGFLEGEDCLSTLEALRALGVVIERPDPARLTVHGVGLRGLRPPAAALQMGNSGTAMRLFAGLLAGQPFQSELVGDASLMQRPMERVAQPLRQMGAAVETLAGRPPVRVGGTGRLTALHYDLPVASAQVKSALLLAGLYADGVTSVTEPAVTRDHTERMLRSFGAQVRIEGRTVAVSGPARLSATDIRVPGDFSSAAFFIVAGCLAAEGALVLRNVGVNPTRTGLLDILRLMGARISLVDERMSGAEPVADLRIERSPLRGVEVPPGRVPLAIDEFPALFVAAACAQGTTRVSGAAELRVKESDRIVAMARGLQALGVAVEVLADGLVVHGGPIGGGRIDSLGDHRIAMAFAMASLRAREPIEIAGVANVATSFPGFVDLASQAGLAIETVTGAA